MIFGAQKFEIELGGSALAGEALDRLIRAEFVESIDRLDVLRLVFNVPLEEPGPVVDAFELGQEFKITLGNDESTRDGYGDITELAHDWSAESGWNLTVTGLDRLHRLRGGTFTRVFQEMKHSDIISQIAGDHGLTAQAESVSTGATDTFQANESNAVFIKRLARLYNYHVRVEDKKLIFGRRNQDSGDVTLYFGYDLEELSVRASLDGVVSKVTAVGWDSTAVAKVESSTTALKGISGSEKGAELVKKKFGERHLVLAPTGAAQTSSTTAAAEGALQASAEKFVQGHLMCMGNPAALPLAKLILEGGPTALNGEFLISQVSHVLEPGMGYKSRVEFFSDGI